MSGKRRLPLPLSSRSTMSGKRHLPIHPLPLYSLPALSGEPRLPPPFRVPEAEQAALQKALHYLVQAGINADRFHIDDINAMYLPGRAYWKEVRVLTSITDPDLLTLLFAAAAEAGQMEKAESLDARGLLNLARWAKKGTGLRNNVTDAQKNLKIVKKAALRRSRGLGSHPKTATLALLLNEQLQDMRANEKDILSRHEAAVERSQNEINVLLKQEMEMIEKKYEPASLYKPPNKELVELMTKLCYEKYVKDCEANNVQPVARSDAAQTMEAEWSNAVLAEHKMEFTRNLVVADQLRAWCRTKIEKLEAVQDSHGSAELRCLLACFGGEPIKRNI